MWAIKILKGPQAGQIIPLKNGPAKVGRVESAQIRLATQGISKEHAVFSVSDTQLSVEDLGSTNGTFVNGVKVKTRILRVGDRISFHNVIVEVLDHRAIASSVQPNLPATVSGGTPAYHGNAALASHTEQSAAPAAVSDQAIKALEDGGVPLTYPHPQNFQETAQTYFESVALPGVYRLAQNFEIKWVLVSFVLGFVFLVTCLSVFPMMAVTKASLEQESQRRAMTIAHNLAERYNIALINNSAGSFDTRFASREDGVQAAFIMSAADGSIIAPATKVGEFAQDTWVTSVRKTEEQTLQQIDDTLIGASVPIRTYDQETGSPKITAYSIILYNMGSLAIGDNRVVSLFVRVLGIALIFGIALFVFLYKLVEVPVLNLNYQLDAALKMGTDKISSKYQFPAIQKLVTNINSALSRALNGQTENGPTGKDIYLEATHIVRMMLNPSIAIDTQGNVIAINAAMAESLNVGLNQLDSSRFANLPEDSLVVVGSELIQTLANHVGGLLTSPIHFKGQDLELVLQPIRNGNAIEYMILALTEKTGGG